MQREEHLVGDTFAYRYPGQDADHVLLVQHGIGGHGGIYDRFGAHYASLGAEVWSMDAPGHGRSCVDRRAGQFTLQEWVDAALLVTEHITTRTGLPVFIKGSSLGAAAAYGAFAASDTLAGAVLMGFAIPSSPLIPTDNPFRSLRFDIDQYINFEPNHRLLRQLVAVRHRSVHQLRRGLRVPRRRGSKAQRPTQHLEL